MCISMPSCMAQSALQPSHLEQHTGGVERDASLMVKLSGQMGMQPHTFHKSPFGVVQLASCRRLDLRCTRDMDCDDSQSLLQ